MRASVPAAAIAALLLLAQPQPGLMAQAQAGSSRETIQRYKQALESFGDCEAARRLREIYLNGEAGIARDEAEAAKWVETARMYGCLLPRVQTQPRPNEPSLSPLNPLWLGTWKSEDGKASITIAARRLVHTFLTEGRDGKPQTQTVEHDWSDSTDSQAGAFGYSADRTSPEKISQRYEEAVRESNQDPTDFAVSDPAASRRAIAAISPGTYRILWSYEGGDCLHWEYILDGNRMLETSECKYGFDVVLYNRTR
ncbi:hypothetical protein AYO46_06460 [Betaproteobacteria bacterium SCGC AG-212-J23]|nr:hypothetical protein AYO46_06460 [Betaproteobacteria bacterium SCGC AG-212-J23]